MIHGPGVFHRGEEKQSKSLAICRAVASHLFPRLATWAKGAPTFLSASAHSSTPGRQEGRRSGKRSDAPCRARASRRAEAVGAQKPLHAGHQFGLGRLDHQMKMIRQEAK